MDWNAIGAIGEIVGATAVVVTLIFLTFQLRQNTKAVDESRRATLSQLYQFRANMHMDGMLRRAESSGLNVLEVEAKAFQSGVDALSATELEFMRLHSIANAVRLDNGLFQHQNGFLDEDFASYVEGVIAHAYPIWLELGILDYGFRPGFVKEAKRIFEKQKANQHT
jgi:hypothetical protein